MRPRNLKTMSDNELILYTKEAKVRISSHIILAIQFLTKTNFGRSRKMIDKAEKYRGVLRICSGELDVRNIDEREM